MWLHVDHAKCGRRALCGVAACPSLSGYGVPLANFELGGVPLASSWLSCAMGVSLSVGCCPPRQRIDDDDAGNEVHVVHELDHDSLDDLPAVMSVMPPGHFFIPLIAPTQGAHTFPRCRVRSPVDYCRIGLWTF